MKILVMVLSASAVHPYELFMQAQKETWDSITHPNIETMYYDDGKGEGWQGNTFFADCPPGYFRMHWKFKQALDAVWDKNWDMIFRVNSSSYVDKHMLWHVCKSYPAEGLYTGWKLGGKDLPLIEWESKTIRQECVSGAGIFMSRDVADILRRELPEKESVEDDVLFGRILQLHGISVLGDDRSRVDIRTMKDYRNSYHYRFRTANRYQDIENMRRVHAIHLAKQNFTRI